MFTFVGPQKHKSLFRGISRSDEVKESIYLLSPKITSF